MTSQPHSLFLHIGSEKTGTKSIQQFLSDRHRILWRRHRVHYPVRSALYFGGAHSPFTSAFLPPAEVDFLPPGAAIGPERIKSELQSISASLKRASGAPHAILLSSEHLSSRLDSGAIARASSVVRDALPDYATRVIYFVRSQPGQYCAGLSTHLKSAGNNWVSPDRIFSNVRYYNHLDVATDWRNVFGDGNISVVNYHRGNAISSLLEAIAPGRANESIPVKYRNNKSLSYEQSAILRAINSRFAPAGQVSPEMFRFQRKYVQMVVGHLDVMPMKRSNISKTLSDHDRKRFIDEFGGPNDELQKSFRTSFNLNDHMDMPADDIEGGEQEIESARREIELWQAIARDAPEPVQGEAAFMDYMNRHLRRMRYRAATI